MLTKFDKDQKINIFKNSYMKKGKIVYRVCIISDPITQPTLRKMFPKKWNNE